jgi:hypothetical protein
VKNTNCSRAYGTLSKLSKNLKGMLLFHSGSHLGRGAGTYMTSYRSSSTLAFLAFDMFEISGVLIKGFNL